MASRCELCDLELDQCIHGLAEQRRKSLYGATVQVSSRNVAHLEGCMHKGEHPDFSQWGEITTEGAWRHLCDTLPADGEALSDLVTNAGAVTGLQVMHVCKSCREHGRW